MDRLELQGIDAFIAEARARGVSRVALRGVDEIRPVPGRGSEVVVGPQRWVDVTAYHAGVVLALRLEGALADDVERVLTAAGFVVKSTSDNIA